MRKKVFFQQMVLEHLNVQKNELEFILHAICKKFTRWTIDVNLKFETVRLIEKKHKRNVCYLGLGQ